jgi:hypothetical protein
MPDPTQGSKRNDRIAVYLDQNQWSNLDNGLHDKTQPASLRAAADQICKWVEAKRIILPISSGHYTETTNRFSTEKRYRLGLTMLKLSAGWQMRDPLEVRHRELIDSLRIHIGARRTSQIEIFTLLPNVLHSMRGWRYKPPPGLDKSMTFWHEATVSAIAQIEVMLDEAMIKPVKASNWASSNQHFSDWLDGVQRDSQQKRRSIDAFVLNDFRGEIAQAAASCPVTTAQLRSWLSVEGFIATGGLSLEVFRQMMHHRHLNIGTTWRVNDLTDMVYLSCAAGYGDFVVTERHMGTVLRQSIPKTRSVAKVFFRLQDAVPAIGIALNDS